MSEFSDPFDVFDDDFDFSDLDCPVCGGNDCGYDDANWNDWLDDDDEYDEEGEPWLWQ